MKKTAVIYAGKYGSTRKYAQWIAEETGADLFAAESAAAEGFAEYDIIVFGGAIHAGGILEVKLLKKLVKRYKEKKILVFAVGINVESKEAQEQCRSINFVKRLKNMPCAFLPGAYDPAVISRFDRRLMSVVENMLLKKGGLTPEERKLLDAVQKGADYVQRENIAPIVDAVKALNAEVN